MKKFANSRKSFIKTSTDFSIVIFLALALPHTNSTANASTFVGNGGNAGDVELQVSVNQIFETLKAIASEDPKETPNLCSCTETFANHEACDYVKSLQPQQKLYCGNFLKDSSPKIRKLLAQPENVRYIWTREKIEVSEAGRLRAADAVADPAKGTLTLNVDRFLAMSPAQRIFLLTHEFQHLMDTNGKHLTDEEAIGPFNYQDGGRALINSVAAATVMQANEYGLLAKYRSQSLRSKAYKETWLSLSAENFSPQNSSGSSKAIQTMKGTSFQVKHYLGSLLGSSSSRSFGSGSSLSSVFDKMAVVAGYSTLKGDRTLRQTIKENEEIKVYSLGLGYRYFPFTDPISFWGQSHFVLIAKVEFLEGNYTLKDDYVSQSDSASQTGPAVELQFMMPIAYNFWIQGAAQYSSARKYKYKDPNIDLSYDQIPLITTLGASYAF